MGTPQNGARGSPAPDKVGPIPRPSPRDEKRRARQNAWHRAHYAEHRAEICERRKAKRRKAAGWVRRDVPRRPPDRPGPGRIAQQEARSLVDLLETRPNESVESLRALIALSPAEAALVDSAHQKFRKQVLAEFEALIEKRARGELEPKRRRQGHSWNAGLSAGA